MSNQDSADIIVKINCFILELYDLKKRLVNTQIENGDNRKLKLMCNMISLYKDETTHEVFDRFIEQIRLRSDPVRRLNTRQQNEEEYNSDFEFDDFGKDSYEQFINESFIKLHELGNFSVFKPKKLFLMNYVE